MVINDQTITSLVVNLSQTKWSPDGQVSNVEFISCHIQVSWFWKTKLSGRFSKRYFLVFWLAIESESVSLKTQSSPDQSASIKIPSTNETPLDLVFTKINFYGNFYGIYAFWTFVKIMGILTLFYWFIIYMCQSFVIWPLDDNWLDENWLDDNRIGYFN